MWEFISKDAFNINIKSGFADSALKKTAEDFLDLDSKFACLFYLT